MMWYFLDFHLFMLIAYFICVDLSSKIMT